MLHVVAVGAGLRPTRLANSVSTPEPSSPPADDPSSDLPYPTAARHSDTSPARASPSERDRRILSSAPRSLFDSATAPARGFRPDTPTAPLASAIAAKCCNTPCQIGRTSC